MQSILKYFPNISEEQKSQFEQLYPLYLDWNSKVNVISRKDIENLYEHHVLHSLAIARIVPFTDGTSVVDIGTGGGFPGIPLAILFPNVKFHLVDSVGKKIKVASDIAEKIGLKNVTFSNSRMEQVTDMFDFAVSRAAMPLNDLVKVCRKNIHKHQQNALPNGLICLKGGDLQEEMRPYSKIATLYSVTEFFKEEYFQTKKALYLPL